MKTVVITSQKGGSGGGAVAALRGRRDGREAWSCRERRNPPVDRLGRRPLFHHVVLKAWTSRIEPRRTFMKSSGHFQPMNSTKAITSPREARCVCCDLRRPTQASKMAATEV